MLFLLSRKHEVMHRMMTEKTKEMKIFFDKTGKITFCNNKALQELGYGMEIYEHTIQEIFRNVFHIKDNKPIVPEHDIDKPLETFAYRQNHTCFPVELYIIFQKRKKNNYGLCLAVSTENIREANRKIEQLQSEIDLLNRNRSEITANITHELRTPVNGIMGLSDNLLDMELSPEQAEIVRLIKRCCTNMNAMINDLLDYAKITNEKMSLEQREFNLRECMNAIIESNRPRINDKGLKLLVYISDDIPEKVIGDELRLTQIMNNLLSNAVKFTVIGQIAIEVVMLSKTVNSVELFFMVIDTGIGISNEDKDKLFQSFTQVDGSITRRFGGTGLGLAISKKLVEAMGGTIGMESEKGKGSTFSFSVRLAIPAETDETGIQENRGSLPSEYDGVDEKLTLVMKSEELTWADMPFGEVKMHKPEEAKERQSEEEILKKLSPVLEKLSICIEMESWDKAEELAYYMKKQMPAEQSEIAKLVFRLLLAVRKEKYDASVAMINELEALIGER